jgi:4-amino-4-deoxy-L-arabinose transferase-like glycosyltransferase
MVGNRNRQLRWFFPCVLILLFGLALFIRLEYLKHTDVEEPIRGDAYHFYAYGFNLRHFGIFSLNTDLAKPTPDSFRAPGYPLLIAVLIFFTGDTGFYPLILYCQAILSSLLVILTYILGLKLLPRWGAMLAGIGVAISPHLISIQGCVLSETLFTFVLLLATTCFYEALKNRKQSYYVTAALLFGAAFLINETVLLLPPLLVAIIFLINRFRMRSGHRPMNLQRLAVFLLVFLLIPFWWLYRSSQLPDDALKSSKRAIITLSHGAYPGFVYKDPKYKNYPYREDPRQPEFGQSLNNFVSVLWERFRQRPVRYLSWYILEKPYYLWSWNNLQSHRGIDAPQGKGDVYFFPVKTSLYMTSKLADLSRQIMKYLHPVIMLLAISCIPLVVFNFRKFKSHQDIMDTPILLLAFGIYYTIIYSIFSPWPRYSVPLRPQLYICATWSAVYIGNRLLRRIKGMNAGRSAMGAGGLTRN